MKYAWIENNKIRELCVGNPTELFHSDIAKHFDTEVADTIEVGAELINGVWINASDVPIENTTIVAPKLSPIEFKMCFTSQERIAISALKATDAIVADAYEILDDVRLTEVDLSKGSVIGLIDYLTSLSVLTVERAAEVKLGKKL